MSDRKEGQLKEYMRLKLEYLKRNDLYRKYCKWARKNRIQTSLSISRFPHFSQLRSLYRHFGDMYSKDFTFEEWWESNKELFVSQSGVRDFKQVIRVKIERILHKLRTAKKREPSLHEFIEYFVEHLNSTPERALIEIDLGTEDTMTGLRSKLGNLIKPLKENPRVKEYSWLHGFLYDQPPRLFRPVDLERNLKIYCYREDDKLSWRQIAARHIEERYTQDLKRRLQIQFKNAKTDIENIVSGRFPTHRERSSQR
jgi:hypothetical protein